MSQRGPTIRNVSRVRNAIGYNAVFRSISQIGTVTAYILLVRLLSENDYGRYQLFYSVPVLIGAVFSLGIGNSLARFLPEYFQERQFGLARRLVTWCGRARLLTSVAILTIIIYFWDQIAPIFKILELREYFLIFAAITITHFQCRILELALNAYLLQKWSSGLSAAFALLKALGYAAASVGGLSLMIALVIDLAAYFIFYLGLRLAYSRHIPHPTEGEAERFSTGERRRILRYAAFYNFNDVGSVSLTARSDYLFIAGFLDPLAVGAYAFCTQLDAMLQRLMPIKFFLSIIRPLVFTLDYHSQKKRASQYFRFLTKITYLSQFPVFILILSVPTQIITVVFAGKFIEYSHVLVAILAFSIVTSFQAPVALIAQLAERAGIILASKIFSVYNIVANVILIPQFGIIGAVIATGSANLLKNVFIWIFVRDVASFRGTGRFFLRQVIIWSCCWVLLRYTTQDLSPIAAIALTLLAVGISAVIGLRLADFSKYECELITKLGGERASRILKVMGVIRH